MLDAYFIGDWSTRNFQWQQIGNEVVGSIILTVCNPITGKCRDLTGSASIQIMCDKIENRSGMTKSQINSHYLDMANKKPNALELGFPKLEKNVH